MALRRVLSLLLFVCVLASSALAATWTTIDVPGAVNTVARGINSAGDLVGSYADATGIYHGFLFKGGTFSTVDPPGALYANATGINDTGQITGWFVGADRLTHGFFFDGQNFTTLDFPGNPLLTLADGLNNAAEVVGGYIDVNNRLHGFKWSNGSYVGLDVVSDEYTFLGGINNRGQIVGTYQIGNEDTDFVLNPNGRVRKFSVSASPYGINDNRIVVGGPAGLNTYGFRFNLKSKALSKVRFPGASVTTCVGINNTGQIVGAYSDASGNTHGFLRTK